MYGNFIYTCLNVWYIYFNVKVKDKDNGNEDGDFHWFSGLALENVVRMASHLSYGWHAWHPTIQHPKTPQSNVKTKPNHFYSSAREKCSLFNNMFSTFSIPNSRQSQHDSISKWFRVYVLLNKKLSRLLISQVFPAFSNLFPPHHHKSISLKHEYFIWKILGSKKIISHIHETEMEG